MKEQSSNVLVCTVITPNFRENEIKSGERTTPEEAVDREQLEERLCEVTRNVRCVWRAVKVMVFLTALAVVGLGYSTVLIPYWPQTTQQFLMYWPVKAHCALGCASLSCAVVFIGLALSYRKQLSWLVTECARAASEVAQPAEAKIIPLMTGSAWNEQTPPMDEVA
jgi:hypothetical protein